MEKTNKYFTEVKKKLPTAILAGMTPALMYFFFGVLDIFGNNRDEFLFSAGDFAAALFFIALGAGIVLSLLIAFLPGYAGRAFFGVAVWIAVMGLVQSMLFNGSGALGADVSGAKGGALVWVNLAVWAVTGITFIAIALLMKKIEVFKVILVIAVIMVAVMQLTGTLMQINNITRQAGDLAKDGNSTEKKIINAENAYLSSKGLTSVSSGKNVIIFLVDRFDVSNYDSVEKEFPGFFDRLDGFTYFGDNISLYSRTYPAAATMITGIDNDFSEGAEKYFKKAYTTSPFLNDLKNDNFRIKLYTQRYYSYRNGAALVDVADNIEGASSYRIANKKGLIGNLIALSSYRYLPNVIKEKMTISTASFYGIVETDGENPLFETDDSVTCAAILDNRLTIDGDDNSYIFIHLNGCHYPFNLDENGRYTEESSTKTQLRGCFTMIYKYIEDLKSLGVYDSSTIIITGDHPDAVDDCEDPQEPRVTALFVKPAGATGALKHSLAQVSQENLIPTIIKSAGVRTERDYGRSYFEVPEGETVPRYHKFQRYIGTEGDELVKFEITGYGRDFDNWKIVSREGIGELYK